MVKAAFTWGERITSDDGTIDAYLAAGAVTPQPMSVDDAEYAIQWLATYGGDLDDPNIQSMANVIGFLIRQSVGIQRRGATFAAKTAYAAEHGIPVSQVRVKR